MTYQGWRNAWLVHKNKTQSPDTGDKLMQRELLGLPVPILGCLYLFYMECVIWSTVLMSGLVQCLV